MKLVLVRRAALAFLMLIALPAPPASAQGDRLSNAAGGKQRLALPEVLEVAGIDPAPPIMPAPRANGHVDLSGVYQGSNRRGAWDAQEPGATPGVGAARRPQWGQINLPNEQVSLTPEARQRAQELLNRRSIDDPTGFCLPEVAIRMMPGLFTTKLVQTQNELIIIYEYFNAIRIIPIDGRPHAEDAEPTFQGDSVGRWEGDTLVVDVTNFKEGGWLGSGLVHSDQLHVVERYSRPDKDVVLYEATFTDPQLLARPWTVRRSLMLREGARVREYVCAENNLDPGRYQEYLKRGTDFMRTPPPPQAPPR